MTYWFLLGYAVVASAGAFLMARYHITIVSNTWAAFVMAVGVTCAAGALLMGAGFVWSNVDRASCTEHHQRTGIRVTHSWINGCYVRTDDGLVPYDRWIQVTGVNAP